MSFLHSVFKRLGGSIVHRRNAWSARCGSESVEAKGLAGYVEPLLPSCWPFLSVGKYLEAFELGELLDHISPFLRALRIPFENMRARS
ncbi:MAG: hypothetical protein BGO01_12330 [Armatimonadetes bacterium 55-13]|nr:hypothetical protein [Armatimonadota bacterium]OJU61700.1 MAG: hypothetical protein BGO01_12330 [Armatimonadetes bacterium 55-13]